MGTNPINLAVRFILEIIALVVFGYWGWNSSEDFLRIILVVLLPLIAAVLWGTFAVLNDPSRSGKAPIPVSGIIRLILELVFFALAAFALYATGNEKYAWIFGSVVLVHYLLSYDRITWLLRQKLRND